MLVDADLDGGAIAVLHGRDPGAISLALRPDTRASFMQWFNFAVRGAAGRPLSLRIENAGDATYPDGWDGYRACATYDGEHWFRVPTDFDGRVLSFSCTPDRDVIQFAYFAAYPFARHDKLLDRARRGGALVEEIGRSVEGRAMSLVTLGSDDPDSFRVWITARQHPGETMAEWFMEGLIARLLDPRDQLTADLLARVRFHLMPGMNPDGGVLGNLRTNAAGENLNATWSDPDEESAPEVCCVRDRMGETGVDLFLDVHGDERNPYCFAAGNEGNPGYSDRIDALEDLFMDSLVTLDEDFQREYGYERDAPGQGDLGAASNWVGETFDCLALTLEMPFKDNENRPDPRRGWSPERARGFGRTTLESVFVCLDALR